MPVKIPQVNTFKPYSTQGIKQAFQPRHIVSAMASDGFLPVIALEAFVEAGRTYQAYKRGGFDEARERITEEFSGAVFWLGGVTGLNWIFEKIGQKILSLPKKTVDIASDNVRKPLNNFLNLEKLVKNGGEITPSMMSKFKFAKVIASVLIANAFIGFVLPKINQAITRSYHKNDKNADKFFKPENIADFGTKNNGNKDVSFGGGAFDLLNIANKFENNRNWKLLAVDAGTCSGRVYSARNDDERVEIAFRDLSSIYFYMFNMPNLNKWLNMAQHGYATRLDPVSAKFATEYMNNYLDSLNSDKVSVEQFQKEFLGEEKIMPENLKSKFKNGIIKLEEFKAELKNIIPPEKLSEIEKIADKMSELQQQITEVQTNPSGKKIVIKHSVLTQSQAQDVLNGGHINNPEFLKDFYRNHFGDKKYLGEYRFIPQSDIDTLKADLTNYVKSIISRANKTQNKEVTKELLSFASKHNFRMNTLNWGLGFAISAAFLSTFIPKIQYFITKKRTGENAFPGTEQYRNN